MSVLRNVGAVSGLVAPILAFTCILLAIATYPKFSWVNNALSDLGVVTGITGILFNLALVASGILGLIFVAFGLFNYMGKVWVGKLGSIVFASATVALIFIGVFNENFSPVHYLVSVLFFTLAPIAFFILTCAFWLKRQQGMAAFTVMIGVVAALPWILEFTVKYVHNVAIPETISGLAVSIWVMVLAQRMLQYSA